MYRSNHLVVGLALSGALLTCNIARAQSCAPATDLYLGYYLENPLNNPEDPVPGALFLNLPIADGPFAGEMFFTYAGCQTQNIGEVMGLKQGNNLSGTWSGVVDNTNQSGSFSADLAMTSTYTGTYTVDGGKQFIDVPNCAQYFIAANGTVVLTANGQASPDDALISYSAGQVSWTARAGAEVVQCQLIDIDAAQCGGDNAVLWQQVAAAVAGALDVPTGDLVDGKAYNVSCGQFDTQLLPLAFSKAEFVQGGDDLLFSDGFEQ